MRILITNPEVDAFTRYLLFWSRKLIKELKNNNEIIHLEKDKVKRERLEGTIKKKGIDLVLLNGHGDDEIVLGNDGPIVDGDNIDLLKEKIVHAMSCSSAKKLGKTAVEKGVKAYVGYNEPYLAPRMDDKISNPLKDSTAALFLDPAFIAQKALANNKTPSEAVNLARKEYNRSIIKALTSPMQSDNDQFVGLLLWDRDHLIFNE